MRAGNCLERKSDLGEPNRRVAAYYIQKDGKTGGMGEFSPVSPPTFTIAVQAYYSFCNTATATLNEMDGNEADNTDTVCVEVKRDS